MVTSGQTAGATSDDTAITLLTVAGQQQIRRLVMINEEGVPGFFSVDSGATWCRWPDTAKSIDLDIALGVGQTVKFKRHPGGTDATKLYAWGL